MGELRRHLRRRVLDASLLLMTELDFHARIDARLRGTVAAVESHLRRGDFLLRYDRPDDFGSPETAFLVCTFWWIQALAALGERERAREEFEKVLACRNRRPAGRGHRRDDPELGATFRRPTAWWESSSAQNG